MKKEFNQRFNHEIDLNILEHPAERLSENATWLLAQRYFIHRYDEEEGGYDKSVLLKNLRAGGSYYSECRNPTSIKTMQNLYGFKPLRRIFLTIFSTGGFFLTLRAFWGGRDDY